MPDGFKDGGEGNVRRSLIGVLALAVIVPGCLAGLMEPSRGPGTVYFHGWLTESATRGDVDNLTAHMKAQGADEVLILESYPLQFQVDGLAPGACRDARAWAEAQAYVSSTAPCRTREDTQDPEAPVSTG